MFKTSRICAAWAPAAVGLLAVVLWRHVRIYGPVADVSVAAAGGGLAVCMLMIASAIRRSSLFTERVLIVGSSAIGARVVDEIGSRLDHRYQIIGVVDDAPGGGRTAGLAPRLGSIARVDRILAATRPDRIVIAVAPGRAAPIPEQQLLAARLQGVAVDMDVVFLERVTAKVAIESLTPHSLILADGFHHQDVARSDVSVLITRVFNVAAASAGLVILAPLLALVAVLIRIDSRGPVLFVQPRIGQGGRPFGLIKFRTMRQAETRRSEWVRDNADRITRVGKWLRRFRLDELPQLVNVLRGEMNLVGPRPHPLCNYELFSEQIPYYVCRASVRPGITGWAQVRYGYANGLDEETEKMRYDLYYIKHRSFWFDLRILVETARAVAWDRRHDAAPPARARLRRWPESWHAASGAPLR